MSTNILDLSDDDLILLFSHLSFADLLVVAGTCQRFRRLAKYTFHLYPKRIEYKMRNNIDDEKLIAFEAVLQSFGADAEELTFNAFALDSGIASRHFFNILIANCSPLKFKSLRLVNTKLTATDARRCQNLLERLEKIELIGCTRNEEDDYCAFVLPCKQLKTLTLINLGIFNDRFLWNITEKLESLHLQKCYSSSSILRPGHFTINIGSQIQSLVLWGVLADVHCPSKDLSNLRVLKTDMNIRCMWQFSKLLAYAGNQLKVLHLVRIRPLKNNLNRIGNQLESLVLLKCSNMSGLLENMVNLRSMELRGVQDKDLFLEMPRRVPNVERLSIYVDDFLRVDLKEFVLLTKLKSLTLLSQRHTAVNPDQLYNFLEDLSRIESLECLNFSVDPDAFNEKSIENFHKLKSLKSLTLSLLGLGRMDANFLGKIVAQLVDLEALKIGFQDANAGDINREQFAQIVIGRRSAVTAISSPRPPLKVYQERQYHFKSMHVLRNQLDEHSSAVQLLPLRYGYFNYLNTGADPTF